MHARGVETLGRRLALHRVTDDDDDEGDDVGGESERTTIANGACLSIRE